MIESYIIDNLVDYYWDIITHEYDIINNVEDDYFYEEETEEESEYDDYIDEDELYEYR